MRPIPDPEFIPYGDEGELICVRGWYREELMKSRAVERLIFDLGLNYADEWLEDVLDAKVRRGWARFWQSGDRSCPYGADGGVKLSKWWRPGYVPATWMYTH